jgi:hypothetical protein
MITYQEEAYSDCVDDLVELYPEHYAEVEQPVADKYKLDPNWEQYFNLEKSGSFKVITCRDEGTLVGYMFFIISPHLHVKSCMTAYEDIYFLRKDYRKGRTGIKMFQYAEQYLKSLNVNRILCSTKVHQDNSRLFEYLGYSFVEKLFHKFI